MKEGLARSPGKRNHAILPKYSVVVSALGGGGLNYFFRGNWWITYITCVQPSIPTSVSSRVCSPADCSFHLLPYSNTVAFPGISAGKEFACNAGDLGSIPGSGRSPGGEHGHSSILTWRIPWTEKPGGLQSMGRKELDMTKWLRTR